MWVKKSYLEIEEVLKNQKKRHRNMSLYLGTILALAITFLDRYNFFTPANEIINKLPYGVLIGSISGISYFKFKKRPISVYMCLNCNSVPTKENPEICKCGQPYVDLELYTWVEG